VHGRKCRLRTDRIEKKNRGQYSMRPHRMPNTLGHDNSTAAGESTNSPSSQQRRCVCTCSDQAATPRQFQEYGLVGPCRPDPDQEKGARWRSGVLSGPLKATRRLISYLLAWRSWTPFIYFGWTSGILVKCFCYNYDRDSDRKRNRAVRKSFYEGITARKMNR
jgi:hypothetical protein